MLENVEMIRYRQIERMNGRVATWFHYNRLTLVILLSAIATLAWINHIHQLNLAEARADNLVLALGPAMMCYSEERSTSLLIVGDNQRAVDNALRHAGYLIDATRGAFIAAKDRATKKGK